MVIGEYTYIVAWYTTSWKWTSVEIYGKDIIMVLTGCFHSFRKSKRPVLISPLKKFFKAMLDRLKRSDAMGTSIFCGYESNSWCLVWTTENIENDKIYFHHCWNFLQCLRLKVGVIKKRKMIRKTLEKFAIRFSNCGKETMIVLDILETYYQ